MTRTAEQSLNDRIMAALGGLHPVRVENVVGPGTPDINFACGWIEDKAVDFPSRASTVVSVPHYTTQQRAWHMGRAMCCRTLGAQLVTGRVFVALEDLTHGHFFMIDGARAAQHLGIDWTREKLNAGSELHLLKWDARRFRNFIDSACHVTH